MAYTPTNWKTRVVEKPNTFTMVQNQDGTVTLIPYTGAVTEIGTPTSANNMNKIETELASLDTGKVNITDIIDDLTHADINKALSANQGKTLNNLLSQFVGMISDFACTTAPSGWLAFDGTLHNRADYPLLWNHINNSGNVVDDNEWLAGKFGKFSRGDGSTTFRVPKVGGYFRRSWDNGAGVDTGRELGSIQQDDFKSHTHELDAPAYKYGAYGAGGADNTWSAYVASISLAIKPTGGTETRPKNIAYLTCIKY